MSANTEREIRLTEIPTELRNLRAEIERWREAHALALTRAGELERQFKAAVEARDAARKTVDDLTDHCDAQARRIASLELDCQAHVTVSDDWRRRAQANFSRADKLAEWIEQQAKDCDYSPSDLSDLLLSAGVECRSCDGAGFIRDEDFIGDPGSAYGYRTRDVTDECDTCHGIGKVLR
jgi:hypothetical protein